MSNHLNRILELKKLQEQKRQEELEKAERVQAAKDFIEEKDKAELTSVVGSPSPVQEPEPTVAPANASPAVVGTPTPVSAPKPKRTRRKEGEAPRKSGRPRRPGKHLFFCLGFIAPDGTRKLSSTSWKTGAYGLKKALATLEWSRQQTGDDDFLVVIDPAVGLVSMAGVNKWPTPIRGNTEIPTTIEGWLDWATSNGSPTAEIQKDLS